MFSLCPPTGGGGGGEYSISIPEYFHWPHVLSGGGTPSHNTFTGPMSFPWGTPVTCPGSLLRGYPIPRRGGGATPVPGGGIPKPGQDGVPHPARIGWGTPGQVRMGYPPGQDRVPPPPPGIGYAWTDYAAGGTPLAVSQKRTVLFSS